MININARNCKSKGLTEFVFKGIFYFLKKLPVIFQNDTVESLTIRLADILKPGKEPEKYEVINVVPGSEVKVSLMLKLPDKSCVNNEAPSKWTAVIQGNKGIVRWHTLLCYILYKIK